MPCRMDDYDAPVSNLPIEETQQYKTLKKEADAVTALLCSLCESLPEKSLSPAHLKWWNKHKKADRIRIDADLKAAQLRFEMALKENKESGSLLKKAQEELQALSKEADKIYKRK